METGFAHTYGAALLYAHAPQLSKADLLTRLRAHCGHVEPLGGDARADLLAFVHVDDLTTYKGDKRIPAQCLITPVGIPLRPQALASALGQTWDWPEARTAVAGHSVSVAVTDFLAEGLEYHRRLALFRGVVRSVLDLAPCLAMHWDRSDRIVDPAAYLKAFQDRQSGRAPSDR